VAWQHGRRLNPYLAYDRYEFPGFDAYAYVAAAEHPTVFTVAPWGYRVLTPAVAQAISGRSLVKAFRRLTVGALALAGVLLFLYLRRLGHGPPAALLGTAIFALSGPVAEVVAYPFLAEPLTLLLEVGFLLALRAGAGVGVLAFIGVLGVMSKEFFVLLLPLVWLESPHEGRAAWRRAALVSLPALLCLLVLRLAWVPHLSPPGFSAGAFGLALSRLVSSWREWSPALLLYGLGPMAVVGLLLPEARARRPTALYVAAVTLLPPFFNPVAFFPWDIPRLLIYLLPVAVPLALVPVGRLAPRIGAESGLAQLPAPDSSPTTWAIRRRERIAWAGALLLAVLPLALLDRYRRTDLASPRDGPLVLAVCRETLRAAGRLDRGLTVRLDPEQRQFEWGVSDPGDFSRMRWFLREGFGPRPHYGMGPVVTTEPQASFLLPVLTPRQLALHLRWSSTAAAEVTVKVNGHTLESLPVRADPSEANIPIPSRILFRGDNVVTLDVRGVGGVRLLQIAFQT
jgi:hypothetical protein